MGRPKRKPTKPKKPVAVNDQWQRATPELVAQGNVINVNGRDVHTGASPYARWKASGSISPTQELAIDHCLRLWELTGITGPSVTAGYGERIPGGQRDDPEWLTAKILDAKDDLRRIEGYFPRCYWQIFENCIRHDEPAGRAGSRIMGWGNASAVHSARTVVQFVADIVADKERLVA